ncbi:MAG: hypothetical protein JWR24_2225 [Actinoallomurus sp.]|nr:hypothetical protein [Actinoallomurus sp.]
MRHGFDVHAYGYIDITGAANAGRAVVLLLGGLVSGSVHAAIEARRCHRHADPLWVDFHQTTRELIETPGMSRPAYEVPRRRGAAQGKRPSAHRTEGSRDG